MKNIRITNTKKTEKNEKNVMNVMKRKRHIAEI